MALRANLPPVVRAIRRRPFLAAFAAANLALSAAPLLRRADSAPSAAPDDAGLVGRVDALERTLSAFVAREYLAAPAVPDSSPGSAVLELDSRCRWYSASSGWAIERGRSRWATGDSSPWGVLSSVGPDWAITDSGVVLLPASPSVEL